MTWLANVTQARLIGAGLVLLVGLASCAGTTWLAWQGGARAARQELMTRELAARDATIAGQQQALATFAELTRRTQELEMKYAGVAAKLGGLARVEARGVAAVTTDPDCGRVLGQRFPPACRVLWASGTASASGAPGTGARAGAMPAADHVGP